MRILIFCTLVTAFSLVGCSKESKPDYGFYDRANSASEKSLQGLDRDTK